MNMMTATGMVATLHAYVLMQLRIARIAEMHRYIRRVVSEECRKQAGKPYDWRGVIE